MSNPFSQIPAGSGRHPVVMIAIAANRLAESAAFYRQLFGWQTHTVSAEVTGAMVPAGPQVSLRAGTPAGFPGVVPFIRVDDVDATLGEVIAAGGTLERAPWVVPMAGTLARFRDPGGTLYGLISTPLPAALPRLPMPFGDNPKPPPGAVCSLELYAADGGAAAAFVSKQFGWGVLATMPQYTGFDSGAGAPGVFQSHTPALPAVAYIWVADAASKLDEIDAAGGQRVGNAMAAPGMGTFGYFKDVSGTSMGLISP